MVDTLKKWLARKLIPDELSRIEQARAYYDRERGDIMQREAAIETTVNQRVAMLMSKLDPLSLVMREYNGIFHERAEHVEDKLDARGQLAIKVFAYGVMYDPAWERLTQFVMDAQGNTTLKDMALTTERTFYGRAFIASVIAIKKELERLGNQYADMLKANKKDAFDTEVPLE